MDFVDWCDLVLQKVVEACRKATTHRSIGVQESDVALLFFDSEFVKQPAYYQSSERIAINSALNQLQHMSLLEKKPYWKVTRLGRDVATDKVPFWFAICQEKLDEEHEQLLKLINQWGIQLTDGYTWLKKVNHEILQTELSWADDSDLLWSVAQDLEQWGYIAGRFYMGGRMELYPTYRSLVWETRRGFTLLSKQIDELVAEWETTSVDFKRELHLDSADEKAEFIKDILSLANTKASGQHWMIIGFDNRSHAYYGSPDVRIDQNRLEQIVSAYTSPTVDIQYEVADYKEGPVGMLEVFRDQKKLPYSVARSIGDRKRIEQYDIFVRHGSQVEKPTALELQALQEEGDRARLAS